MVTIMINLISQSLFISGILSSIILVTVLILRRLFSNKISIKILNLLWVIVLIRLITPITIQSPVYIQDMFNTSDNSANTIITAAPNLEYNHEIEALTDTTIPDDIVLANKTIPPENTVPNKMQLFFGRINWINTAVTIWILGAAVILLSSLMRMNKFKRLIFNSRICTHQKSAMLIKKNKNMLNINKKIVLRECAYINVPVIIGVKRPTLLMPVGFLDSLDDSSLSMIILHEMCHIKSNDILKNNLWLIAKVLNWYNPLMWLGYKAFLDDMETNCDQVVLSYLSDNKKVNYFDALLNVIKLVKSYKMPATMLCFCRDKSKLRKRVDIMIKSQKPIKSINTITVLVLIIAILACFTTACTGKTKSSDIALEGSDAFPTPEPTVYDVNEDNSLDEVPQPTPTVAIALDNSSANEKPERSDYAVTRIYDGNAPIAIDELKVCDALELRNVDTFDFLNNLENIKSIYISSSYLKTVSGDIAPLATLNNLESINLSGSKVSGDINCLKNLTKLRVVFMGHTLIEGNISSLKNLVNLQKLALNITPVTGDIEIFENIPYLEYIFLDETSVTGDIKALKNCKVLEQVFISTTSISGDISVLKNMPYLEWVALEMTNVSGDIAVFKYSQYLRIVYLFGTQVNGDLSALQHLENLEQFEPNNIVTGTLDESDKANG